MHVFLLDDFAVGGQRIRGICLAGTGLVPTARILPFQKQPLWSYVVQIGAVVRALNGFTDSDIVTSHLNWRRLRPTLMASGSELFLLLVPCLGIPPVLRPTISAGYCVFVCDLTRLVRAGGRTLSVLPRVR